MGPAFLPTLYNLPVSNSNGERKKLWGVLLITLLILAFLLIRHALEKAP